MDQITFPVVTVCGGGRPSRGYNIKKLEQHGYHSVNGYYHGSVYHQNGTRFKHKDWRGLHKKDIHSVMSEVTRAATVEDLIDKVKISSANTSVFLDLKEAFKERVYYPHGRCFILSYDHTYPLLYIYAQPNQSISVHLTNPFLDLPHKMDMTSVSGDAITSHGSATSSVYRVKIKFSMNREQDIQSKVQCTDYGEGHQWSSFAECFEHKEAQKIYKIEGCIPYWYTYNQSKVCKDSLTQISSADYNYITRRFIEEDQYEFCGTPCKKLKIEGYHLRSFPRKNQSNLIKLEFDQFVKAEIDEFSSTFERLLASIGGFLALFLGIRCLNIYDMVVDAGSKREFCRALCNTEIKTPSPPSFKLKNKDKEPTADPAHSCVVQYSDKETATVELFSV